MLGDYIVIGYLAIGLVVGAIALWNDREFLFDHFDLPAWAVFVPVMVLPTVWVMGSLWPVLLYKLWRDRDDV